MIHLFQRDEKALPDYHQSIQRLIKQILAERGINLHLGETVCQIAPKHQERFAIKCESGLMIECQKSKVEETLYQLILNVPKPH